MCLLSTNTDQPLTVHRAYFDFHYRTLFKKEPKRTVFLPEYERSRTSLAQIVALGIVPGTELTIIALGNQIIKIKTNDQILPLALTATSYIL